MVRITPTGDNRKRKSDLPGWVDTKKLRTSAGEEVKKPVTAALPNKAKDVVISYSCTACNGVFPSSKVEAQKKQAVREGRGYLVCPTCSGTLKEYKTTRIIDNAYSGKNTREVLTLKPGRVPNTWVDKAVYGRMVSQLGKFCTSLKMLSAQLRFQRGIRANHDGTSGPKQAEFSVDYVDSSGVRKRIFTTISLPLDGVFVAPKTFHLVSGVEYPFTRESLSQIEHGETFEDATPKVPVPRTVYRDRDITNWPHVWSQQNDEKMRKVASNTGLDKIGFNSCKTLGLIPGENTFDNYCETIKLARYEDSEQNLFNDEKVRRAFANIPDQNKPGWQKALLNVYNCVVASNHPEEKALNAVLTAIAQGETDIQTSVQQAVNEGLTYSEIATQIADTTGQTLTPEMFQQAADVVIMNASASRQVHSAFQPGSVVNYKGIEFNVGETRPDGVVILKSPTTGDVAYVPPTRQGEIVDMYASAVSPDQPNITANLKQVASGMVSECMGEIQKEAARDKATYSPIVEKDPDHSLAEQTTQSEAPFNVPYNEMDQGILPEDKRNYMKMFRADRLSLQKHATIKHEDGKWKVYNKDGTKLLGTHDTKEDAQKQIAAIEISKQSYKNPHDHQHPYEPKTKKFPGPDKKQMEELDKAHPKKPAYAETTDYKNDGSNGWPFGYDRCVKLLESKLRQDRNPIVDVDLQALKDGKYSRAEIEAFLDKLSGGKTFTPPATAKIDPTLLKTLSYATLMDEIDNALKDELEGQKHYEQMMSLTPDQETDQTLAELSGDEAKHHALLTAIETDVSKEANRSQKRAQGEVGDSIENREDLAEDPNTPVDMLRQLARDAEWTVRFKVSHNPSTPPEILRQLASDPDINVRTNATERLKSANKVLNLKKLAVDKKPVGVSPEIEEELTGLPVETPLPTEYKVRKIAPPGIKGEEPSAPTPEMSQAFRDIQAAKSTIDAIDTTIAQAREALEAQIRTQRASGGYDESLVQKQQSVDKLAQLMELAESKLVRFGDSLAHLHIETKERLISLTTSQKLQALMTAFGTKADKVLKEAEAQARAMSPGVSEEKRQLSQFPYRGAKIAYTIQTIADVMTSMNQFISLLDSVSDELGQLETEIIY